MHRKKFLLIFLFILLQLKAFSAVFVVTSNADSGPGTLRDALTQAAANGTAATDYINFNLSDTSETGRTIALITQLPDVTSNLVIDASTQTGGVFGESTARIEIACPQNYNPITVFNGSNVNDVEIYGIYFYDYYDAAISYPGLQPHIGVKITNSTNFIFGAAGKGNLMRGFNYDGLDIENTIGVTLKSNMIGFGKSGSTEKDGDAYGLSSMIYLYECNNIQIGGNPNEGNVIFTFLNIQFYQDTQNTISIKSNNFMVYPDGTTTEWALEGIPEFSVQINTIFSNDIMNYTQETQNCASVNMDVENNLTGGTYGIFMFNFINGTVNFTNNYFNIARDGVTNITYYNELTAPQEPVNIQYSRAQFNFGTNSLSQKNLFYNCGPCIAVLNDPNIFIRNNDYKCVYNSINPDTLYSNAYDNTGDFLYNTYKLPVANISKIATVGANTIVNGTASPNSIVDIYSSESCITACSIRSYMQTVNADNNGNWQANLNSYNGIFWVSATINNQTSKFSSIQVNSDSIRIQPMRCTDTATITGLTVPQGVSYYWANANGKFISNNINLITTQPGQYQLVLNGGCIRSPFYQIDNDTISIAPGDVTIKNPSCGSSNGSISLFAFDPLFKIASETWTDGNGKIIGDTANINNIPPGNYTFMVKTSDGCTKTYGPINLKNTTGPNIDQSNQSIQSTNCGQSTGAITNLAVSGSGTLTYTWLNSQQQTVGTHKDLTGVPAGVYQLKVTDASQCGPIYSTDITIPETNGITMDESAEVTTNAACGNPTGSITGIQVTGATAYVWTDANNKTYTSATADLTNIPPGSYTLTVSNIYGCSKTSKTYTVTQPAPTQYPVYTVTQVQPCFGQSDGSLTIATDFLVKSERWVNSQNQSAGSGPVAANLPADTYRLFLTDNNGCESAYGFYSLQQLPQLQFLNTGLPLGSTCGLSNGSITDVQVAGGMPPYTYKWTNADTGVPIGTNSNTITNLSSGNFNLEVTDSRCGNTKVGYFIADDQTDISTPAVTNVELCSSGGALVKVNNPVAGSTYRLYDTPESQQPLAENETGQFTVSVTANRSFYITQAIGTCESSRAQVDVSVGISAINIANTFTPNGDNINDYWVIKNIENYPNALVQVFNRYGQKLFESKGYGKPFDGTYNSQKLPSGVYYYIINLSTNCNLLSGSLTIIR